MTMNPFISALLYLCIKNKTVHILCTVLFFLCNALFDSSYRDLNAVTNDITISITNEIIL